MKKIILGLLVTVILVNNFVKRQDLKQANQRFVEIGYEESRHLPVNGEKRF